MAVNDGNANGPTRLIPVKVWPELHPWPTEAALRNIIFHSQLNGFANAFVRHGRRILVDEPVALQ